MTVKSFFKSVSFKCIAALLCVLLVSGIFLTVAYALLEVTPEERLARAINKIYGKEVEYKTLTYENNQYGSAEIKEAYEILVDDQTEYLVQSLGKGGYGGGSVTCWVTVQTDENGVTGVGKVTIAGNSGQSFINKVGDDFLNKFSGQYEEDGYSVTDDFVATGASRSSNAVCNAVNGALEFIKTEVFGADGGIYTDFLYTQYINTSKTSHTVDGETVTYNLVTRDYGNAGAFTIDIKVQGGAITDYTIIENGSTSGWADNMNNVNEMLFIGKELSYFTSLYGEDMEYKGLDCDEISTGASKGASNSAYLCMFAGAFAVANYQTCLDSVELTGGASNE